MSKGRILIIEDELLIANNIAEIIEANGYEVVGIEKSVVKGVFAYYRTSPDLLLLDIKLSGDETGIDLANRIRQRYETPVIFVTANSDKETVAEALAADPFGFVKKPINTQELLIAIDIALSKSKQNKLLQELKLKNIQLQEAVEVSSYMINSILLPLINESKRLTNRVKSNQEKNIYDKIDQSMILYQQIMSKPSFQESQCARVPVYDLVMEAVGLLKSRLVDEEVHYSIDVGVDLEISCQPSRMVASFYHLINSAIDSLKDTTARKIEIAAAAESGELQLSFRYSCENIEKVLRNSSLEEIFNSGDFANSTLGLNVAFVELMKMGARMDFELQGNSPVMQVLMPLNTSRNSVAA